MKSLSRVRLCDPTDCSMPGSPIHGIFQAPPPWDFPGKNTGVGCYLLLQGIFLTQGSNPGLPHCRQTLYRLNHQGSPSCKDIWHLKKSISTDISTLQLSLAPKLGCEAGENILLHSQGMLLFSFCKHLYSQPQFHKCGRGMSWIITGQVGRCREAYK